MIKSAYPVAPNETVFLFSITASYFFPSVLDFFNSYINHYYILDIYREPELIVMGRLLLELLEPKYCMVLLERPELITLTGGELPKYSIVGEGEL